jgi:hypothetical protein
MYTNNGYAFGKHFYLADVNNFTAGYGIPPGASCVGILVATWSNTKIVFAFGESYDTPSTIGIYQTGTSTKSQLRGSKRAEP